MIDIESFKQIYDYLIKDNKIKSLKDLSNITGSNYTYLSELNTGRKPLTLEFVQNINIKLGYSFNFNTPEIASEPQEIYNISLSKYHEYIKIIKSLAESNEILARSVEKMADSIHNITDVKHKERREMEHH